MSEKQVMIIHSENTIIPTNNVLTTKWENVIETISLDSFDKKPYQRTKENINNDLGSIYLTDGQKWTKLYDYKDHNYEQAVVLDIDPIIRMLFVYGNKIGNQCVKINQHCQLLPSGRVIDPFYTFYRGDNLLLYQNRSNKFNIIHNITRAAIRYERDQYGPRIR